MISRAHLKRFAERRPFLPFRIHMASNRTFEIRHPELIEVGKTSAVVYRVAQDALTPASYRADEISLVLIESVEQNVDAHQDPK
jgi:hypothetical protein